MDSPDLLCGDHGTGHWSCGYYYSFAEFWEQCKHLSNVHEETLCRLESSFTLIQKSHHWNIPWKSLRSKICSCWMHPGGKKKKPFLLTLDKCVSVLCTIRVYHRLQTNSFFPCLWKMLFSATTKTLKIQWEHYWSVCTCVVIHYLYLQCQCLI